MTPIKALMTLTFVMSLLYICCLANNYNNDNNRLGFYAWRMSYYDLVSHGSCVNFYSSAVPDVSTVEHKRLSASGSAWKQWGPYLAERQWGTVREDKSEDGNWLVSLVNYP